MKKILFIATIFIFCMGLCCFNPVPDNDLWARLIAGAHIVEKLSLLKTDFLSYTPTHTWYDHEWGASAVFYTVLKYFGASGLVLLQGLLFALTVFICFKTVELRQPKSTTSYNIFYFAIMAMVAFKTIGTTVRCLLFTSLFFALSIYLLERARQGNKKILFLLPLIMLFWCNIHGGCISLLGLLGIYIIGEFLNKNTYKEYIYVLIACLAVLFINPYGIEYVKFLFAAGLMDRGFITEWNWSFHPKFVHSFYRYKLYLVILLLTQLVYLMKNKVGYKALDKTKFLLVLLVTALSIMKMRHQSFFVFTAGTLLYDEFYCLFNKAVYYIREKLKLENKEFITSFCTIKEITIYFMLLLITFPVLVWGSKQIKITEKEYPRFAVEFIRINELKGNLLINFDWGSYAAYKLYPDNLIFMDGRYEEVYNHDLLLMLKDFHLVQNDWDKILRDYKTDVIVIEKKYPVFEKMLTHTGWKLVFENNISGVFVPSDKLKEKYLYPSSDDEYYNQTEFDTGIKF